FIKTNSDLEYNIFFVNKLLSDKFKYGILKHPSSYINYLKSYEDYLGLNQEYYDKTFFFNKLDFFSNFMSYFSSEDDCPLFIKYTALYLVQFLIKIPEIFIEDEKEYFWSYFGELLNVFDDDLLRNSKDILEKNVQKFILFIKYGSNTKKTYNDVILKTGNNEFTIDKYSKHNIWFQIIEIKNNNLICSGFYTSILPHDNIYIEAVKDFKGETEIFKSQFVKYSDKKTVKFLSHLWNWYYSFDFKIPIKEAISYLNTDELKVSFRLVYEDNLDKIQIYPKFNFSKQSNLSKYSHYSILDDCLILFKLNAIIITNNSFSKILKNEFFDLKKIISDRPQYWIKGILFRFSYLILFIFMKNKRIWIFMDRKNLADDNAEHLFKYSLNQKEDIEYYFVVNKDSVDYNRLLKINKNVLAFGSIKHKIIYLFAEKVISSHPGDSDFNPFWNKNNRLLSGLFTLKKYYLRHGVSKDNMSRWLKKDSKNLSLILASSVLEKNSLLEDGYNYDESIIQALGLPRYDNLNNNHVKKQIVIMPSWRNYIKSEIELVNSEYFKRWNNLINNRNLIDFAEKNNYQIIFKPHPNLYKFIDVFDENEYVIIDYEKKYQEIFNESSILITDYSSIFFDFAYLKKPLIYYHYGSDYHFDSENGYFKYDTMGFGDVIKEENDLVNKIKFYIANNCEMEDKYKSRVDDFFMYTDTDNCKRVYEWILSDEN
ncbi:CDP-glycerol glycerophosphotransferase family protein, partial [Methanobrevibacter sp.]|uniref:CDP-glycerol glycerophosphotransferase family protein n=1 Tax=Methanobrevibacter sp. TaxID=66852 RepID=UPI0026DF6117